MSTVAKLVTAHLLQVELAHLAAVCKHEHQQQGVKMPNSKLPCQACGLVLGKPPDIQPFIHSFVSVSFMKQMNE